MRNIRLLIEYDGTCYHGWQTQPGEATIQRTIEMTIERIVQEKVNLTGSGRTDARVHALGQVANFRSRTPLEVSVLKRALNGSLPKDVVVRRVDEVPLKFDSCLDAIRKTYRYSLLNRAEGCAIGRFYTLHIPHPLNVESMTEAAFHLHGKHDFSSFRSSSCSARNPVRWVTRAEFIKEGDFFHFFIESNGFLHHMVRSIMGTLIDVGRGRRTPSAFREILEAKDRRCSGKTAQPQGLCLMEVNYPETGTELDNQYAQRN